LFSKVSLLQSTMLSTKQKKPKLNIYFYQTKINFQIKIETK